MLLIPMQSLRAVMDSVSPRQSKAEYRLILAILTSNLMSCYDWRLLVDAFIVTANTSQLLSSCFHHSKEFFDYSKQNLFQRFFRTTLCRLINGILKLHFWLFQKTNLNRLSYLTNSLCTASVRWSIENAPKPSQQRTSFLYRYVVFFESFWCFSCLWNYCYHCYEPWFWYLVYYICQCSVHFSQIIITSIIIVIKMNC